MSDTLRKKITAYIEWIHTQTDSNGYLDSQYRAQIDAFDTVIDWIDEIPESDALPSWAKEAIEKDILNSQENLERSAYLKNKMSNSNWISRINAMNWVLNLRKPESK